MAKVLPLAIAGAVSPTVLAVALVVLSGKVAPKARGVAFVAGVASVVVAISLLVVFVFGAAVPESQKGSDSHLAAWLDLGFAALLLVLGAFTFLRRNHPHKEHDHPDSGQGARVARFYALGLAAMLTNLTTLAVLLPALKEIAIEKVSRADQVVAMAVVDVIVLTPVWLPLLLYMVSPRLARKVLDPLNSFLLRHETVIAVALCLVFAAYLTFLAARNLAA